MISVGIDVSKGKSTVCIMKPYGEVIRSPYEVNHTIDELSELAVLLLHLDENVKVVMEVTGTYHLPILMYLKEKGIFASVVNPIIMKKYVSSCTMRKGKTDKIDSRRIAAYGIDKWYHLIEFNVEKKKLSQMQEIAMSLKEYPVVRAMHGVGDRLAPRLIGEIGDINRFHNGSALIAYAGIDTPPYQSGE